MLHCGYGNWGRLVNGSNEKAEWLITAAVVLLVVEGFMFDAPAWLSLLRVTFLGAVFAYVSRRF